MPFVRLLVSVILIVTIAITGVTLKPNGATPEPPIKRPDTSPMNYEECGKSERVNTRIIGGNFSALGHWPWMVALYNAREENDTSRPVLRCGATLISDKWIITAAKCVKNNGASRTVRLGDLNLDPNVADNASPTDELIEEIIPHPQFSDSPVFANDIALLRLKNSVKFTSNTIRPICLLSGNESRSDAYYSGRKPIVVGWGLAYYELRAPSPHLQEIFVDMINNEECASLYADQINVKVDHTILCTKSNGKGPCMGDGGGPLMFPVMGSQDGKNNRYFLGGIVSVGVRCGKSSYPGVYTRVAAYTDWINQVTGLQFH